MQNNRCIQPQGIVSLRYQSPNTLPSDDQIWFQENPLAQARIRACTPSDRGRLTQMGCPNAAELKQVKVLQIEPGMRVIVPYPDSQDWGKTMVKRLRKQLRKNRY